jgi:hypothetical protein
MTTLKVNAIEPEGATTNLVIGESGQNTVISNNDIRANVLQDAGGNALFTSNGSGVLSGVNSAFGSDMVLLSTQTASDSASISFTSGIDSTYKEYIFKFYNINPATNSQHFGFQVNASGESGYNETITSTFFRAYNFENDAARALDYLTATDQAQGTAAQQLFTSAGNDADKSCVGELHLFNPAGTTYVKHFYGTTQGCQDGAVTQNEFAAGYINVTAAIDDIQFKMSSGNFDGKIKMWGVK